MMIAVYLCICVCVCVLGIQDLGTYKNISYVRITQGIVFGETACMQIIVMKDNCLDHS